MTYRNGIVAGIELKQRCRLYFDEDIADTLPDYVIDTAIERFLENKDMVDADDIASMVMMKVPEKSHVEHEDVFRFVKTFKLNITGCDIVMEGVESHG